MAITKVPMTVRGEQLLRAELTELKSVSRPRIIQAIATAREHGDLKENAEYHAAREQQSFCEGRIQEVEGVSYAAFIVPGLIMLSVMTQSISNASFGIFFPKFTGTIYELLSAPINFLEIVLGYVGAAQFPRN